MIVAKGSEFPKTVSALKKIQGIGDYTAGAIASIAFKEVSSFWNILFNQHEAFFKEYYVRWYLWLMGM